MSEGRLELVDATPAMRNARRTEIVIDASSCATYPSRMTLSEAWEAHARDWITWVRKPGHDSYDRYHRDQFLPLLPPPGRRTLDVGCGEGRLTRHLASLGHRVVGIDASPTLIAAARELTPE